MSWAEGLTLQSELDATLVWVIYTPKPKRQLSHAQLCVGLKPVRSIQPIENDTHSEQASAALTRTTWLTHSLSFSRFPFDLKCTVQTAKFTPELKMMKVHPLDLVILETWCCLLFFYGKILTRVQIEHTSDSHISIINYTILDTACWCYLSKLKPCYRTYQESSDQSGKCI